MKKITTLLLASTLFAAATFAGTTLRYENKDSDSYTFQVTTCGNHTEVKFDGSTTGSVTIQGCDDAVILNTSCGDVKVKEGDRVIIKDGCVKIDN